MSTPITNITSTIVAKETWLKQHERLILGVLLISLCLFLGNRWMNHVAQVDYDRAVVAQKAADDQTAANKILQQQVAQQTAQYEQEKQAREQEMQSLIAAIASRDSAAAQKVTQVSAPKTSTQAVSDLSSTYTLAAPVTVTATGADVPTVDIQQFTVTKIEHDEFAADLSDEKKQVAAAQDGQQKAESLVTTLQSQVTGLNESIKKNDVACTAEKKDLQAQARKSKFKWFVGGFVVGITTRIGAKALAFASGL